MQIDGRHRPAGDGRVGDELDVDEAQVVGEDRTTLVVPHPTQRDIPAGEHEPFERHLDDPRRRDREQPVPRSGSGLDACGRPGRADDRQRHGDVPHEIIGQHERAVELHGPVAATVDSDPCHRVTERAGERGFRTGPCSRRVDAAYARSAPGGAPGRAPQETEGQQRGQPYRNDCPPPRPRGLR